MSMECLFSYSVVYDFSWGDMNKHLFTIDSQLARSQRNSSIQVQLQESLRLLGLLIGALVKSYLEGVWVTLKHLHH